MTIFATATPAAPVKSKVLLGVSYGLGAWTTLIAVSQMISFEDFVNALRDYQLVGQRGALALAITLLAIEVFSVPFLFRLPLSPAARFCSALFMVVLPYIWTFLALSAIFNHLNVPNSGYFGGLVHLPLAGAVVVSLLWMTVVAVVFGALGGRKALRITQ